MIVSVVVLEQIPRFINNSQENNFCFVNLSFEYLDDMFEYSTKEGLYDFFEGDAPRTKEEGGNYLDKLLHRNENVSLSGESSVWFILDKNSDKVIGSAGYVGIDLRRGNATMTFAISPDYWGKSIAFDMLYSLVYHGFSIMRLNRLSSMTYFNNLRLISFIETIGFKKEGCIRKYYKQHNDGKLVDAVIHGILRDEVNYERCMNFSKILSIR